MTVRVRRGDAKLYYFNNFLTVIIVALALYVLVTPVLPQLNFWLKQRTGQLSSSLPYSSDDKPGTQPIPQDNRLVIPQLGLDDNIHEGKYADVLKQGLWRRPNTSTPDKGGNTVIVGHRFTYRSPAVFYHLDKLKIDDKFAVYWQGQEYTYIVTDIKVVEPDQTEVEDDTPDPTLTLYTCTPLWTSKQRLVIIAKPQTQPVNKEPNRHD